MFDVQTIVELTQGVGFPIFVSVYLLLYQKREIEMQRESLNELRIAINSLTEFLKFEKQRGE